MTIKCVVVNKMKTTIKPYVINQCYMILMNILKSFVIPYYLFQIMSLLRLLCPARQIFEFAKNYQ